MDEAREGGRGSRSGSKGVRIKRGSQRRSQRGKSRSFRWRKGELLGAGTFGCVYRVLNEDDGSLMAVKELTFSAGSKAQGDEVRREVELLRNLSHTNIVRYLGTEIQVRGLKRKHVEVCVGVAGVDGGFGGAPSV